MTEQWPDNIVGGAIRYGRADNYDGFYLADAAHGIPTFGSVSPTDPVTVRGQSVRVFNYPAQTEQIAAELVKRWNSHDALVEALRGAIGALEFSRDYHKDLGNEEQAFTQDRLDAALRALEEAK